MIQDPLQVKKLIYQEKNYLILTLAIFNDAGDLTGGLLYAAKKFGLKTRCKRSWCHD